VGLLRIGIPAAILNVCYEPTGAEVCVAFARRAAQVYSAVSTSRPIACAGDPRTRTFSSPHHPRLTRTSAVIVAIELDVSRVSTRR
jgi:hypothetical protein